LPIWSRPVYGGSIDAPASSLPAALSIRRPKGEQLRQIIQDAIAGLEPGQPIPSERMLASRFRVARMTVRQVLDRLVESGVLYRKHGQGTFVAHRPIAKTDRLTSFSEDMIARGLRPGAIVLAQWSLPASSRLAATLEIPEGAPVIRIERLRHADGVPMAHERSQLPADLFPGLAETRLDDRSLYDLVQTRWGVTLDHAEQRVSAVVVDGEEARLLGIGPGDPGLLFHRVTRDATDRVVEYTRSLYRADRYEVALNLRRAITDSPAVGSAHTTPASRRR
jgi:GntR family transcriptional regulator